MVLPSFLTWITPMVWSDCFHTYILALTYLYPTLPPVIFSKHKSDDFTTFPLQSTSMASHCFENKYKISIMTMRPCMIWSMPSPVTNHTQATPCFLLPQGLWTCCCHYLRSSLPLSSPSQIPSFLQVSSQSSLIREGFPNLIALTTV